MIYTQYGAGGIPAERPIAAQLNMLFSLQLRPPTVVPGSALLGGPHATNLLKRLHELLEWGSLGTPTARAFGWRELLEWGSLGTPTAGAFGWLLWFCQLLKVPLLELLKLHLLVLLQLHLLLGVLH